MWPRCDQVTHRSHARNLAGYEFQVKRYEFWGDWYEFGAKRYEFCVIGYEFEEKWYEVASESRLSSGKSPVA